MGTGAIVIGLASIVIGEVVFGKTKFRGLDPEQPDLTNIGDTDGMTMNALLGVNISF